MNALVRLLRKLAVLSRRQSFDRDLQEEMAFHREQAAKEFEAGGIAPEAARYAATRWWHFARKPWPRICDLRCGSYGEVLDLQ
jgi:hypothetical protein